MKHRNFVVVVSEKGKRALTLSISRPVALIAAALVIVGITAYFIPPSTFHFSATDLRRQQDLGKNDTLLRRKVQSASQILEQAMTRINALTAKKQAVASRDTQGLSDRSAAGGIIEPTGGTVEELCARVTRIDSVIDLCTAKLGSLEHPFDNIPVCNPLAGDAVVCRRFDVERDPFSGRKKIHRGVDIAAATGAPIVAAASGMVTVTENSPIWGKRVVIEHGNGFRTVYAHLGTIAVDRGRRVQRGATIGTVGCTGFATGPHVHYEIWRNDKAVDPERYFYPSTSEPVKIMQ